MKRRDSDDNSLALKFVFEMHPGFVIFLGQKFDRWYNTTFQCSCHFVTCHFSKFSDKKFARLLPNYSAIFSANYV